MAAISREHWLGSRSEPQARPRAGRSGRKPRRTDVRRPAS